MHPDSDYNAVEDAPQGSRRANVLAGIKQKRRDREGVKTGEEKLLRPVDTLDGDVVMRYKYVPMERSQKASMKLKSVPESLQQYYAACDTLILACEEILVKVGEDEAGSPILEPLNGAGSDPVALSTYKELADALDIPRDEMPNARAACLELFQSEYAVIGEAQRVSEWMQTLTKTTEEEILGNSVGAVR